MDPLLQVTLAGLVLLGWILVLSMMKPPDDWRMA
jgi:hypothetical protein